MSGTIRHRTDQSKGCVTHNSILAMIYKFGLCTEKRWRRLCGFNHLAKVVKEVQFKDGIEVTEQTGSRSAA